MKVMKPLNDKNPAKDFPVVCIGRSANGLKDIVLSPENITHEIVRITQADEADN